ncbi:energy transducer TonB [Joostella sp. CR20]|uniref:energy transducer TonB n=1 Tax=Joostella sp. CR20 TaxID=2804312 RepID=UPI00313E6FD3
MMNILKILCVFFISTVAFSQEEIFIFSEVDKIPLFKQSECQTKSEECFKLDLQNHIKEVFEYPEESFLNRIEGNAYVQFTINDKGIVSDIKTRSTDSLFQLEAHRIINLLPQFTPAYKNNIPVTTKYSYAIHFNIEELDSITSYEEVAVAPVLYNKCTKRTSDTECFKKEIMDFFFDNIIYKNLQNHKKTNYTNLDNKYFEAKFYFEITPNGLIQNIVIASQSPPLKAEIQRVFQNTPISITPAKNENGSPTFCYFSDEIKIVSKVRIREVVTPNISRPLSSFN